MSYQFVFINGQPDAQQIQQMAMAIAPRDGQATTFSAGSAVCATCPRRIQSQDQATQPGPQARNGSPRKLVRLH